MTFLNPWGIWFLSFLFLLLFVFLSARLRRKKMMELFFKGSVHPFLLKKDFFFCLGLFFLILALMGPQYGHEEQKISRTGSDIMVLIDLSRSMDVADVSPSRLVRAKRELADLAVRSTGDRLGLIAFAGGAFVLCPLTSDHDAFLNFVDELDTDLMTRQGTNMPEAFKLAIKQLPAERRASQSILLVTDGEDLTDDGFKSVIDQTKEAGLSVYALGIGTPDGGPVPLPEGGFQKNADGGVVISHLQTDSLQVLANQTGGAFAVATILDQDWKVLYDQGIKQKAKEENFETESRRRGVLYYQPLLLIGLLLLLAGGIL